MKPEEEAGKKCYKYNIFLPTGKERGECLGKGED